MSTTLASPGVQAPIMAPGKLELKYLFCGLLEDGSVIEQTEEDKSQYTEGRNAFYELLEVDAEGNPKCHPGDGSLVCRSDIALFQLEDGIHRYLVDLRDGHFEVQHGKGNRIVGAHFYLGFPPMGAKLSLFYFKRRRHHTNVSGTVQADLTVIADDMKEISQECEYHFGWETLDKKHRGEMILV